MTADGDSRETPLRDHRSWAGFSTRESLMNRAFCSVAVWWDAVAAPIGVVSDP